MYCNKCGAELVPGKKFCIKCGAPVNTQNADSKQQMSQEMLQQHISQFPQQQTPQQPQIQNVQTIVNTVRDAAGRTHQFFEKNITAANFAGEIEVTIGDVGNLEMMSFIRSILR